MAEHRIVLDEHSYDSVSRFILRSCARLTTVPLPYLGTVPVRKSRVRVILDFATWIVDRQRAEAAPVEPVVTGQQPFALDERVRTDDEIRCDPLP